MKDSYNEMGRSSLTDKYAWRTKQVQLDPAIFQ